MTNKSTKVITPASLVKGDIILSTTDAFVSKAVKFATNSKYSHARLYIGANNIIEAIDPKVTTEKITDVIKGDKYTAVYRYLGLTAHQQTQIIAYAKKQIGKEYDLSGAVGSPNAALTNGITTISKLSNLVSSEHDFYCSELVAFAYKAAGIKLEIAASQTTPKDLARNKKLQYVGHLRIGQATKNTSAK